LHGKIILHENSKRRLRGFPHPNNQANHVLSSRQAGYACRKVHRPERGEMHSFRIRLILALIAGITVISLASTYFEVLTHKHTLRQELERRTSWLGISLQPSLEQVLAAGQTPDISAQMALLRSRDEAMGLGVYDARGNLLTSIGPPDVFKALSVGAISRTIRHGVNSSAYGNTGELEWLEETVPLHVNGHPAGVLVILEDTQYIRADGAAVWRQSFWRSWCSLLPLHCSWFAGS
jgi:trehalose 6-phosphate synthase